MPQRLLMEAHLTRLKLSFASLKGSDPIKAFKLYFYRDGVFRESDYKYIDGRLVEYRICSRTQQYVGSSHSVITHYDQIDIVFPDGFQNARVWRTHFDL